MFYVNLRKAYHYRKPLNNEGNKGETDLQTEDN